MVPPRPGGDYHGRHARDRCTPSFRLVESQYARGSCLAPHEHAHAHLCIVLQGFYEERVGSRTYQRAPLDVVWYPAEAGHAEAHRTEGRHLLVDFVADVRAVGTPRDVTSLEGPEVIGAALRLRSALRAPATSAEDGALELEEAVAGLVALVDTERHVTRHEPRWLARVEEELRARFREPLTLAELARTAGVVVPHLARSWRRFRGETLGATLRGLRAAHACRRIARSRAPLAEIALEAGFADQSHLGRVLRRRVGQTPAGLRRELDG